MTLDLAAPALRAAAAARPWQQPAAYWRGMTAATKDFSAPVLALGVEALAHNAHDLLRRAGGLPIRVASKSVRSRGVLEAVLALPGYEGVLSFSAAEAVWLSETVENIVVAYPTADRAALKALAQSERAAARVTLMVDSYEQLDFIDSVIAPSKRPSIRICIDFDASWRSKALGHVGALRSPIHSPEHLRGFAGQVVRRPGFTLVGVMSYEAQLAGVGDQPIGKPVEGIVMRRMQSASRAELRERRSLGLRLVREVADLEFVNGGGTGSIESTAAESGITELGVGSGLYGPRLFDNYRSFTPAPALAFALDVVRRPNPHTVTLHGGGWIASGPGGADRLPQLMWPEGLKYSSREGAGEVQTPVIGRATRDLRVGDRVWLRHVKAGEPLEHSAAVVPVLGGIAGEPILSYRGEGQRFL